MKKTNKTRKIAAMIAAMAMAATMAVPGMMMSASADDGSITINNSASNHTYKAYQIFEADFASGVLSNIAWGSGVDTETTVNSKTLIQAIQAITLDTGIITTQGGTATTTPFTAATTPEAVAKVLADGAFADGSATTASAFANDAEITRKFAAAVAPYVKSSGANSLTQSGATYAVNSLDYGYYIVIDEANNNVNAANDAYSRYIVQVVGAATAEKKTDAPSVLKKVKENTKGVNVITGATGLDVQVDATNKWNDVADYSFAETIDFELFGDMPTTISDYKTYYYQFSDTYTSNMFNITDVTGSGSGLDAGDFVVTIDGVTIPATVENSGTTYTNFTVAQTGTNAGFTITFNDILAVYSSDANYTAGTKVSVGSSSIVKATYSATLGSAAVIGLDGNENTVKLTYSNNPNHTGAGETDDTHSETAPDTVIVFTYEQDVTKYLGSESTTANATAGTQAGFKLKNSADKWAIVDTNTGKVTGWADVQTGGTEVKTAADGTFKFVGLDSGVYTLTETTTPNGYNTMADVTLTITATTQNVQDYKSNDAYDNANEVLTALNLTVSGDSNASAVSAAGNLSTGVVSAKIINQQGSTLPSTGGMGTTLFILGGGVTAAAAGIYLVSKKRAKEEDAQ